MFECQRDWIAFYAEKKLMIAFPYFEATVII